MPSCSHSEPIAIIGMSCRFPGGVASPADYWQLVRSGRSGVVRFTNEELQATEDAAEYGRPDYVKAGAVLADIEQFDCAFFGLDRKDAEVMDPQHRLLLQGVWEALEHAGYGAHTHRGDVGLFAGAGINEYYLEQVIRNAAFDPRDYSALAYSDIVGNEKDFLVTKIAYMLNLKGPAVTVQSACSTSLVAAHCAVQSLRLGECDLAVAGGVTVKVPHRVGYRFYQDGMRSFSGECRVFDARADGTVFGNGLGLVVLKPLRRAVQDRDHIYGVIKGSAINNDGDNKVGYHAPAVSGQEQVIVRALENAEIDPQTIQYLEAHGTGTKLGDPIEVAAATKAFGRWTKKTRFCALGSVKSNIGHAEAAAGVASLMKATLSLYHREIPPTLNYTAPNPALSLATSPFYVNAALRPWPAETPRRAAVSSFGIGGTNAHMVLEEAPEPIPTTYDRRCCVLPLSAKTTHALRESEQRFAQHLDRHPALDLADVAYTLAVGREAFSHRSVIVARDPSDAVGRLTNREAHGAWRGVQHLRDVPVVFLFPAESATPASAAAALTRAGQVLYECEPRYRAVVDACMDMARERLRVDVDRHLAPLADGPHAPGDALGLFILEYALGRMWMADGVTPHALIGQGVGEYAAACLAGTLTVPDALEMVARRVDVASPTRLAPAIAAILDRQRVVFLEAGPGTSLLTEVQRLPGVSETIFLPSISVHPDGQPRDDSIDTAVARLWLSGVNVDWTMFYDDAGCHRVPLPAYPFETQRLWIDKPAGRKLRTQEAIDKARATASLAMQTAAVEHVEPFGHVEHAETVVPAGRGEGEARFYLPVWKRLPFMPETRIAAGGSCLLFDDGSPLAQALTSSLAAFDITAIVVTAGATFARTGAHAYVIDPENDADYHRVLQELVDGGLTPRMMLHLWGLGGRDGERSFWSVGSFVKAWTRLRLSSAFHAGVLSANVESVGGSETIVPEHSLVLGACHAIRDEMPNSRCKHFDIAFQAAPSSSTLSTVSASIVGEVLSEQQAIRVAYRDVNRWVLDVEPIRLAAPGLQQMPIRAGGVYWITGGTGGIGLEIADFLTTQAPVTVVLIQRTAFPDRSDWRSRSQQGQEDSIGRALQRILLMESRGSTVLVERADVADAVAMRALYEKTLKERPTTAGTSGALNGVIHAAGVAGGGLLALKSRDDVRSVLAPKVAGTNAMQAVLGSHPGLDFFVLCSSLAALAGGAGRSDYAAANAFLDAFAAERQRRGDSGVVSINWDTWKDTGMAAAHRQRQRERGDGATTTGGHPLLEQKVVADEATTVFKTRFSVATHWVVRDHLIHGVPTVPGAAYIEMIAAALPSGNTPIEIRGLELRHPLALSGGEAEAFTEVRRRETGYGIRILSADPAASGKGVLHVDATAMLLPAVASKTIDIESLTQRLPAIDLQASMRDGDDWTIDGPLRLGPAWNARFESCRASNEELLLGLELPDTIAEPNDDGHLHVSLFDAALSYAVRYLSAGQLYLPFSYGKLSIFGRMPRRIYSYVRYRATGAKAPEILKFDVSICDLHGREIVTVVNFALKKVGDRTAYQRSVAETVDLDPRLVAQHREQDGLATASGVRAFGRVIAARGFPQILVSAGPLQRAVRPERTAAGTSTSPVANASSRPAAIDQASTQETPTLSPRPSLSTQYAAPADEVEQRIALIWQRMLAVEPIGANDDYMELGGDSLIGTHLAEAIAAEFNIEISIVSLYEALTVRGLAQVVRKALSSVRETGDTDRAPTSERTSYA